MTGLKPTIDYNNKFEYIPIITANIYADLLIQIIFDFLFYIFFSSIPRGANDMLDFFKGYAKEAGVNALLGDSFLVIMAVTMSALLNQTSFDTNIVSYLYEGLI